MIRLYPSCLCNRIDEARRRFPSIEIDDWSRVQYPYNLIDLAVRMRPIVETVNSAKGMDPKVELLSFEPSWWFDGNKKYVGAKEVPIFVLLSAIIHESYVHVGSTVESKSGHRLDVMSDRGRWIVCFEEFVDTLRTYLFNGHEIAETVCDMVDNHQELLRSKPELRWKAPPKIGNCDLDWLLWMYLSENAKFKEHIFARVFGVENIPTDELLSVRFSANSVNHATFNLHVSPGDLSSKVGGKKRVEWEVFTKLVRSLLQSA